MNRTTDRQMPQPHDIARRSAQRAIALTPHRIHILTLAACGYTDEAIRKELGITFNTLRSHLRDVYAALGARDRANAVALAIKYGYIPLKAIKPRPDGTAA